MRTRAGGNQRPQGNKRIHFKISIESEDEPEEPEALAAEEEVVEVAAPTFLSHQSHHAPESLWNLTS
jgi:hypothetical protein